MDVIGLEKGSQLFNIQIRDGRVQKGWAGNLLAAFVERFDISELFLECRCGSFRLVDRPNEPPESRNSIVVDKHRTGEH